MRCLLAVIVVMAPLAGRAEWTRTDTALEAGYAAALGMDWMQTRTAAAARRGEMNPILGAHPSGLSVDAYFAGALAFHALVAYALPQKYRTAWQCAAIGVEGFAVGWNLHAGIGLSF